MATDYTETSPVVHTTHGLVRGTLLNTIYGEQFYGFDGIPYAQPPVRELRFKAPQESSPWSGIRDCSKPMDKCLQVSSYTQQVEGTEDCLYLNISVKKLRSKNPLPVMVYVHGGGFKGGDSTRRAWSPDYLMREDVIFISIGHRLGPFAYLSFADPALGIPGNAGLKDVVMALKWIKANANYFNGDANNITLFGHSSGSMSVHMLMLSPLAEGLFDKAILMAGFMVETVRVPNLEYRLAKHLGYQGENNDLQVFDFINKADPKLLASANVWTEEERPQSLGMIAYSPCVEPYATPTALLLDEPRKLQCNAWSNRIPIMLGTTSGEGLSSIGFMKKDPIFLQAYKEHPEYLLPISFRQHCNPTKRRQLGQELVEYFCQIYSDKLSEEYYPYVAEIKTHDMIHSQHRVLNARLAYSKADNYLYRFDFDSPDFNFYRIRFNGPGSHGAGHVDELGYIFKIPATFKLDTSRAEYSTICRMAAMFAEFALRSNPNAPLTQSLVDWKPITKSEPRMCLNINKDLEIIPQPELEKLKFYDKLYERAAINLI